MHTSAAVPCGAVIPELDGPRIRPKSDRQPGREGDSAEVTLRLVQERDRIAGGMNDVVVHRLFSAGLALETALVLMGDHPGAAKVQKAIGELDLAIRDFRSVLFDHQARGRLSRNQPPI
jgi:signal transduction histidine kinase